MEGFDFNEERLYRQGYRTALVHAIAFLDRAKDRIQRPSYANAITILGAMLENREEFMEKGEKAEVYFAFKKGKNERYVFDSIKFLSKEEEKELVPCGVLKDGKLKDKCEE